ncbi:dephospho-CoA kinase [Stenotrophomonas rhizophila]
MPRRSARHWRRSPIRPSASCCARPASRPKGRTRSPRSPLLTEAGGRQQYPWLDRILVVDVPVAVQHARLMQRDGIDTALADRMIAAQASREARLALADDVVVNDGHPDHLQAHVERLDRAYRALATR